MKGQECEMCGWNCNGELIGTFHYHEKTNKIVCYTCYRKILENKKIKNRKT